MYTSSLTVDQVIDAVRAFVGPFIPGGVDKLVRGQQNRVSLPPAPCGVLTEITTVDLETPGTDYKPDDGAVDIKGPKRIDIQVDFYGPSASELCTAVQTAMRSRWAFDQFPVNIKPLYASDGLQAPLTTGEQQYESRWTLTVSMQYNPIVTVPQQYANIATPEGATPVDVFTVL